MVTSNPPHRLFTNVPYAQAQAAAELANRKFNQLARFYLAPDTGAAEAFRFTIYADRLLTFSQDVAVAKAIRPVLAQAN